MKALLQGCPVIHLPAFSRQCGALSRNSRVRQAHLDSSVSLGCPQLHKEAVPCHVTGFLLSHSSFTVAAITYNSLVDLIPVSSLNSKSQGCQLFSLLVPQLRTPRAGYRGSQQGHFNQQRMIQSLPNDCLI